MTELLASRTTDLNRLWLAHECTHFSPCYAFNRFLVLLVEEYCKGLPAVGSRLLDRRRLTSVTGGTKSHKCANMEQCLLHPHVVEFQMWNCGEEPERTPRMVPGGKFDMVVVRHGLAGAAKRLSRQALPYVLPVMP